MTNTEYSEKMIRTNDLIHIDTACLMDVEEMKTFISTCRPFFEKHKKRLNVNRYVWFELARLLTSENKEKSEKALESVELIKNNRDLFNLDMVPATEEDINKAFADPQLLSSLTLNKAYCNQLLITNDKKLSSDAFKLNEQESCPGYKIMVCYINDSGELNCCECVNAAKNELNDDNSSNSMSTNSQYNCSQDNNTYSCNNVEKRQTISIGGTIFVSILSLIAGGVAGFAIGKIFK